MRRSSRRRARGELLGRRVELLERFLAGLDRLGEPDLVILGQQRVLADVGEVQPDEILVIAVNAIFGHHGSLS